MDHTSRNDLCWDLIDAMSSDSGGTVADSPRQVCYKGEDGDLCCTSWSKKVSGLTKGDLVPGATRMANGCTESGNSATLDSIILHGTCMTQCLSDRGKGCS
ncbi:hypothetical protein BJ170DRAFT_483859 [Xylariales sp. AK1849]|nr:hypothetical protein BJ170DRAFT_483859 [Xylariales sp. AK1849]